MSILPGALIEKNGTLNEGPFDEISFTQVGCRSQSWKYSDLWLCSIPAVISEAVMMGREQLWCEAGDTQTVGSGLCPGTEPASGDLSEAARAINK